MSELPKTISKNEKIIVEICAFFGNEKWSVGIYFLPPRERQNTSIGKPNAASTIMSINVFPAKRKAVFMIENNESKSIIANTKNAVPEGA